jgi:hypothetical protein
LPFFCFFCVDVLLAFFLFLETVVDNAATVDDSAAADTKSTVAA